jgi:glycosyltransferase involved in cell wall biosynthesis
MKKKILVIVYNLDRALEHEWFVDLMSRSKYEIHFALIRQCHGHLASYLESKGVPVHRYEYHGKSGLPLLSWKLYKLIKLQRFDIVHAHLFESSISGMVAAFFANTPMRVVTRHHSDFHHQNSKLAVLMDKIVNRLATHLIAVSSNVQQILVNWEGVNPDKVTIIPHGIDVAAFGSEAVSQTRIDSIRSVLALHKGTKIIGMVSRFIDWKGVQFVIKAFADLRRDYPDLVLVLANAQGPYRHQIIKLLESIPVESYRLVTFEKDMPALYLLFDCFVHVPISSTAEAFGQVYIEALASRVPSVVTVSGVAHDYAKEGVNGLIVPYQDSQSIYVALKDVLEQKVDLSKIRSEGREMVEQRYHFASKYAALDRFYDSAVVQN